MHTPLPSIIYRIAAGLLFCFIASATSAQSSKKILIDISHGQKFWNDPLAMEGKDPQFIERIKYMTTEIKATAAAVNGEIGYIKEKIRPDILAKCDLLFIHIPSAKYEASEVEAIKEYIRKGGSLFLAAEVDFWATLEQTNVNDIVTPFGITFGQNSPDTLSGGYTKPGVITDKTLKVTYHGARQVTGGTPFCFNNQRAEPFGTYVDLPKKGGKIIAMGDGMVSLYMTTWKDVKDYQCQDFMQAVFKWLLDK
ncbi:MAG TPA: hypothetical protein VGK59_10275 [Ohtaekwangia sp.]